MRNIFWNNTSNVTIEVNKEATPRAIELLKKAHPNAVIVWEDGAIDEIMENVMSGEK
jgi:hypothetical protein